MTFYVGQKVVCVRGSIYGGGYGDEDKPEIGTVYTIRHMVSSGGKLGFELVEIRNPVRVYVDGIGEIVFASGRFRPAVERRTDIGFAHEILRKLKLRSPAGMA